MRLNTIASKIKNLAHLKKIAQQLKAHKKRIVFTNGCFDILHYGHVQYLEKAKQRGDILIVGINSDTSIKKIKGPLRPIINELDRARTIAGLASVDFVVVFNEPTPLKIIGAIKPDVLIKGKDWRKRDIVGSSIVKRYGGKVDTIAFERGRSTSALIQKIAKRYSS